MIGQIVLALLVVYLLFIRRATLAVAKDLRMEDSPVKVFSLGIFFLLLPFTDEIVGRAQFAYECKKVEGYPVTSAIETALEARVADELSTNRELHAFIPVEAGTDFVVDANTGAILLEVTTLRTYGGWIMRAGLNMGNFSSCNSISINAIMKAHGFAWVRPGFFKRIQGSK